LIGLQARRRTLAGPDAARALVAVPPGGRRINEDACGLWSGGEGGACLAVIADGAGGHRGGATAARLVVESVLAWFRDHADSSCDGVLHVARAANEAVIRLQRTERRLAAMRSTLVVLAVDATARRATWTHVGDSRLYVFRGGRISMQTREQSVVQRMIDAGYLRQDQLRVAPNRGTLLAAIGDERAFEYASVETCDLVPGDRMLLCTDGWWENIDDAELAMLARRAPSTEAWLHEMEGLVEARAHADGDNYSAIAIACDA